MLKNFAKIVFLFSFVFVLFLCVFINTSHAFSRLMPFGGQIELEKADQIRDAESEGYVCPVNGRSIEVKLFNKSNVVTQGFFLPFGEKSRNGNPIRKGQLILGLYNLILPKIITCTNPGGAVRVVALQTIEMFGNSKR